MSTGSGRVQSDSLELVHHYVGGDGAQALQTLLEGFRSRHRTSVEEVQYDNVRLQVKSRILGEDPPDVWTGWPGANLRAYVDADVLGDITDFFDAAGLETSYREAALSAARVDGTYRALPYLIHRANDLYVNLSAAERTGIDPDDVSTPRELATLVSQTSEELGEPTFLLPMKEPWPVLQLWEVVLLGQFDYDTYTDVTGGRAGINRDAIRDALDIVATFAEAAPDDAVYSSLVDANERFVDGTAPVYLQGDWAGGVFDESDGFAFDEEWTRVAFPGTERQYVVVMDALIVSESADRSTLDPFLEYVSSSEAQVAFAREKGCQPARTDVSTTEFTPFGRSQAVALEDARDQAMSMAHGLGVDPQTRIELLGAVASFMASWDSEAAADEIVSVLDN